LITSLFSFSYAEVQEDRNPHGGSVNLFGIESKDSVGILVLDSKTDHHFPSFSGDHSQLKSNLIALPPLDNLSVILVACKVYTSIVKFSRIISRREVNLFVVKMY